jgi:alpha-mannosidase
MNLISRRKFINSTSAAASGTFLMPMSIFFANNNNKWSPNAKEYKIHMIGHGHIDPVWLWPWNEGVSVVHSTFRSVLDRMKENSDFTFVSSSPQFFQWVSENDQEMLNEIRSRVEEGRWNIVGGWWVEPDVNIPNGEAMVRQGLYGQLTFQRLLGRRAKIGFNPDSFGHTGTLPQILKLQGIESYAFMRPGPHEKTIPADIFWWEGLDGTRVLTYRIPISYNESRSVKNRVEQILERFQGQPVNSFMAFYGVGDHGGGPTKINIQSIEELKNEPDAPKVFFSTLDRYFEEIKADKIIELPIVKDDLQHHAVGCYTAEAEIKKGNRKSEAALMTSEKITAIGSEVWGATYPKKEFTSAWKRVLFLQFHDSLAGTSVPEHSEKARNGYGYAVEIADNAIYLALQKLEWQIPTEDPESQYLVVFNPHAWEVNSVIEYPLPWNQNQQSSSVEDENGNALLHQWGTGVTQTGSRNKNLVAKVKIPPMGYRQIRLKKGNSPAVLNPVRAENNLLENEFLRVRFSESGTIGILDKETGREIFANGETGCNAIVIDDKSDTWSHDIKTFSEEVGEFKNAKIKILENGPLRATIRATSVFGDSTLTIDWTLVSGKKELKAEVSLDWYEKLKMLKFSFPVNIDSPTATYEIPYGYIERAANGEEDPGQRWIDVSGKQNGAVYGLTVINDAKYGYNILKNDMRISVIRSAVYAHHDPWKLDMEEEYVWMDQGTHKFNMLLIPHKATWKDNNITRIAEEFMAPSFCIYQGIHKGRFPKSDSFLSVDKTNVVVSAIKQAEDNNDLIIRCVETSGKQTTAVLDLSFVGYKWEGHFRPCEIKSLRLNPDTGKIFEVNLLEDVL